ncbi:glutathione S-transferase [Gregarina niphandrodes]|uniref:Glutathione S-transferase n=1 Tax=Gregarina niphandrodes TaxID=110365 RepID=A0A023B572_GRENI|nr:glutathione S-transferase [Gregarina niphandrodes]EZG58463.1 glutathione S-transferase [Gregarina niphandrodes]|eukprot:XP_011130962.1 glutathione S-transferase [Gregarina niphandrodes]
MTYVDLAIYAFVGNVIDRSQGEIDMTQYKNLYKTLKQFLLILVQRDTATSILLSRWNIELVSEPATGLMEQAYFLVLPNFEKALLDCERECIPFTDVRFKSEEWAEEYKSKAPSGKAPWLQFDDGSYLTESRAILLYAASKSGLVPTDFTDLAVCEQAYSVVFDAYPYLGNIAFNRGDKEENLKNANERLAAADKVIASRQSSEGWVDGKAMTYVDLAIYAFVKNVVDRSQGHIDMTQYKSLYKTYEAVLADSRIKEYYNKE